MCATCLSFIHLFEHLSSGIRLCTNTNKTKYLHLNFKFLFTLAENLYGLPRWLSVKTLPGNQKMQETQVRSLGQEDPLGQEIATQSSILAWKIPWTEKPGGLQSMGSPKSLTQLSTLLSAHFCLLV